MEASVDTLVYQLEDDDPRVRWEALQKLRKIAAVERSHFPVRNPRRFLHCVRRRIIEDESQNALEALRLVTDVMGVLGDDVDQILSSVLPHLVANLPATKHITPKKIELSTQGNEDTLTTGVGLHEETYQVFRRYVVVSNDLKAVAELLINTGLAHTSAPVREAAIGAIARLLGERYARKTKAARVNFKANRMDKALLVTLFQALVPVLEDDSENVVVVAEEALAKLHVYWGDGIDEVMQFLSSEDRKTLRSHQEHIDEFLDAASEVQPVPPETTTSSSPVSHRLLSPGRQFDENRLNVQHQEAVTSSPSNHSKPLRFGFVGEEVIDVLTTSTSNSNADWKRRSAAVEKLFAALKQANSAAIQSNISELDGLLDIVIRLLQDADVHLVKRAIQITQMCFYKFSDRQDGDLDESLEASLQRDPVDAPAPNAAFYLQKMLPHLVETAANFADDGELASQLSSLFAQLFQGGFLSVDRCTQSLLNSMQHRRQQVREEALKVWMVLLLIAQRSGLSTKKVVRHNVIQTLGCLLGDSSVRVKDVAIEAGAVLAAVAAQSNLAELVEETLDDYLVGRVDLVGFRKRLKQNQLPTLTDDGRLSLSLSKRVSPVRSSFGSVTQGTVSSIERSLSSVSELHMLASREFAAENKLAGFRQSRQVTAVEALSRSPSNDSSLHASDREPLTTSTSSMSELLSRRHQELAAAGVRESSSTNRVSPASRGSMSDRSYFFDSSNNSSTASDGLTESISSKLSMLKRKTAQLRKSSSSKHIVECDSGRSERRAAANLHENGSSGAAKESRSDIRAGGCEAARLYTSPEHCGERGEKQFSTETAALTSKRMQCSENLPSPTNRPAPLPTRMPSPDAQVSPQKLQMLQSSGIEDRPIMSKYAVANKRQSFEDGDFANDAETQVPSHIQQQQNRPKHSSGGWGQDYLDERPIQPALAAKAESPTRASMHPDETCHDRKQAQPRMGSASRRQASDNSEEPIAAKRLTRINNPTDDMFAAVEDTYVPSGKTAASRPISLATRKRLEAKAKQDGSGDASSPSKSSTSSFADPAAAMDDPKPQTQKKASLAAVAKAGASVPSSGASAFGKQEPKYLEHNELKPLANPKQDAAKLLEKISGTDWEATFDALSTVRRLAKHHPVFLEDKIHAVTKEILAQVPNLRSTVSKNSLLALESMCSCFQKSMDPEVDAIIAVLIKRSADSNAFVCESATSAITSVILNCSASKVVSALAVHLGSKAMPLRREVARAMHTLIVSMAGQVQGSKDLGTIMNIVGKCLEDSNNEVRDAAKQSVLYLCYEHGIDGERIKKMLPASARSKVDQVLSGNAKYTQRTTKAPASTATATELSVASKAKPVVSAPAAPPTLPDTGSHRIPSAAAANTGAAARKQPSASTSATVDMVVFEALQKKLESSNWKDRYDALQDATTFVCTGNTARALVESGKITGLFDGLLKRMEDGNAKVNVFALECLAKMIPVFGDGLELVLSTLVPVLARNLAASNPKLSALTVSVVQVLCEHVAAKLLCQHFAAIARHANSRVKPLLIDTLSRLAATGDEKTQYALNRCVALVIGWCSLSEVEASRDRLQSLTFWCSNPGADTCCRSHSSL